jgi:hypothetical protein
MPLDNEDIKQLIAILQRGLTDTENRPESVQEIKPRKAKKVAKKLINKFDNMSEKNLHKDDIEFDKKVSQLPPVPRTRLFKPVQVQCRSCGKKESVNPAVLDSIERYKCNKCCANPG